jgi:hypothetical protein
MVRRFRPTSVDSSAESPVYDGQMHVGTEREAHTTSGDAPWHAGTGGANAAAGWAPPWRVRPRLPLSATTSGRSSSGGAEDGM